MKCEQCNGEILAHSFLGHPMRLCKSCYAKKIQDLLKSGEKDLDTIDECRGIH